MLVVVCVCRVSRATTSAGQQHSNSMSVGHSTEDRTSISTAALSFSVWVVPGGRRAPAVAGAPRAAVGASRPEPVQWRWFENERRTIVSLFQLWLEAGQQAVSGRQAVPEPQTRSVCGGGAPVPKGSASIQRCSPLCGAVVHFSLRCRCVEPEGYTCWYFWKPYRHRGRFICCTFMHGFIC